MSSKTIQRVPLAQPNYCLYIKITRYVLDEFPLRSSMYIVPLVYFQEYILHLS